MSQLVKNITEGTTSRYLKLSWLKPNGEVLPTAFDLRDKTPPETYVSFFMTCHGDSLTQARSALAIVKKRMPNIKENGAIALLNIAICLEQINDEPLPLVSFHERGLPHCGLVYLTEDITKTLEAKTTLSFLAQENLYKINELLIMQLECVNPSSDLIKPLLALPGNPTDGTTCKHP